MLKSIFIPFLILLTSCGYHYGYTKKSLPGDSKKISIPLFDNKTQEVGAEVYFTNALTKQFQRSQIAKVTQDKNSKTILKGVITDIDYTDLAQASSSSLPGLPKNAVLTTSYRVLVRARLSLVRRSDNKTLWVDDFNGETVYSAPQVSIPGSNSANPNYNSSARSRSLAIIAKEMMAEAHDRMTESF